MIPYCLLFFAIFSHVQAVYYIGTGRGVLVTISTGNNTYIIKEVPWFPHVGNREWDFTSNPQYPNGEFFHSHSSIVWEAEGGQTAPGTRVILAPQKTGLVNTKNQRWVWSVNNRIYCIKEYPWKYVNVTQAGNLVLDDLNMNSAHQIFKRVYSFSYFVSIRNYMLNMELNVSVNTNGFGNYHLGSGRYYSLQAITGFSFVIKHASNGTVLKQFTPTEDSEIIFGSPSLPVGPRLWNFTMGRQTYTPLRSNFTANLTFSNGKINGSHIVHYMGRIINQSIYGTYSNNGTIAIVVGGSEDDIYSGDGYNGKLEIYPDKTIFTGFYWNRMKEYYDDTGPFVALLIN